MIKPFSSHRCCKCLASQSLTAKVSPLFRMAQHMSRNQSANAVDDPAIIGLRLLAHVVADADLGARFLALSGLDADALRARAGDPGLLAALIDFVAAHEVDLVTAADALEMPPQAIVAAGTALGGGMTA